jgi:hypothetical protein
VLGQLNTIGGYEELESHAILPIQGLSVALTEELAVFAEPTSPGMRLTLVRVVPSRLQVLDSVFTYASMVQSGSTNIWSPSLGTHFVKLSSSRVAVVTTRHDIEIYDVVGDKLVFRGYRYLLEDGIGDAFVDDAQGQGNLLWVMTPMKLTGYEVGPEGAVSPRAQLSVADSSKAFAMAEDTKTLYVGGQGGVFRIDVTDPLHPVTDAVPVVPKVNSRRAYHLEARDGYLVLQEEVFFGTPGDVRVFRIANWKEVASFPSSSTLEPLFTAPTGAAFVDGGLLIQRIRYDEASKPKELVAELYALDDNGAVLKDEWRYRDLKAVDNGDQWQPLSPVAAGRLAIVGPTRRILWTDGGKISELKGSLQGTLDRVLPAGAGKLLAYGSESTHLIDVSNPSLPTVVAGGLLSPSDSSLIRIGLSRDGDALPVLLNVTPASINTLDGRWRLGSGRVTQFDSSDTVGSKAVGSFVIPGGTTQTVADGLLFQLRDANDGGWVLKTFALPRSAQQGIVLSPIDTQSLVGTGSLTSGGTMAVDMAARGLVLASSDVVQSTTVVDWFTWADGRWSLVGNVHVPITSNCKLTLRGNVAVIAGGSSTGDIVSRLENVAGEVRVQRTRELPYSGPVAFAGRILGLDGTRAYVAMKESDTTMNSYKIAVHGLALDTLETLDRYPLPEIPGSMTVVDDRLVFGARTSLTIANPGCELSQP